MDRVIDVMTRVLTKLKEKEDMNHTRRMRDAKALKIRYEMDDERAASERARSEVLENHLSSFTKNIISKDLQDRVGKAKDCSDEMIKIRKEVVDFHGEMVLLENYSALNYTGLATILKKYDKRTGTLLHLPFIQKVLQEPFFTTDLLYKLVKECEILIDCLFSLNEALLASDGNDEPSTSIPTKSDGPLRAGAPKELAEIEYMESTLSALRVLKEIRSRSSTVSVYSLPPLQTNGVDDTWNNKIPILEEAK